MTPLKQPEEQPASDPFLDEPDAITALAQRSFARAAAGAIAENDRLGIPSPMGRDGKIVMRQPPAKTKPDDGPR